MKGGFLGVFAQLLNATVSFVMSVHLPAWNSSASAGWSFMNFDVVGYFSKICQENSRLKLDKNSGYFT